MHSFWADAPDQEVQAFDAFLDLLDGREDFALFHYGSYEKKLLRRMRKVVKRKELVDRALDKAVNVLSAIHASVYFPTFSNGLKDVGRYLGCTWTDEDASGLQSLVWRARWEQAREPVWKDKLLTYNAEDCAALRKVTEFVQAVGEAARSRGEEATSAPPGPAVAWADEVGRPVEPPGVVPRQVRPPGLRPRQPLCLLRLPKGEGLPPHQQGGQEGLPEPPQAEEAGQAAGQPGGRDQETTPAPSAREHGSPGFQRRHARKLAYDLKFTPGGIRRQVIRCTAARHRCEDCKQTFLPKRYKRRDKHLHGLKSWAMYQHVVHRISLQHLEGMFEDCFGLRVGSMESFTMIKSLMARRYRKTCERILAQDRGRRAGPRRRDRGQPAKGQGLCLGAGEHGGRPVYVQAQPGGGLPPRPAQGLQGGAGLRLLQRLRLAALRPAEMPRPPHPGHQRRPDGQPLRRGVQGPGRRSSASCCRSIVGHDRQVRAEEASTCTSTRPRSPASSATWRPASTAPSWPRATRSGLPRTRASSSRSWTTTASPGTTTPPSTRQGVRLLPADSLTAR